mmetsp:Transcript_38458/g.95657  ORF Transcript_38458/g.95657 Transcript_38458/m.95657 type:complete len:597 (+) Transcript_38458:20-1810(+)
MGVALLALAIGSLPAGLASGSFPEPYHRPTELFAGSLGRPKPSPPRVDSLPPEAVVSHQGNDNFAAAILRFPRQAVGRALAFGRSRSCAAVAALLLSGLLNAHRRLCAEKKAALMEFVQSVETGSYHTQIFTTASLPWKTGTAINPLLRAAYLASAGFRVTLCLPWLHPAEQAIVYPNGIVFETPAEQEAFVRNWLLKHDGEHPPFEISFYPARYDLDRGSILPLGDTSRWTSASAGDLCILEEPEHLNWYHLGRNWRRVFKLVVGVVHTNYISYARMYQPAGAGPLRFINTGVCRAYCDRLIKLSDTLQPLPRSMVCNVHGVRSEFIELGRATSQKQLTGGAYFIGKVLWAKGYSHLIDYLAQEVASGKEPTRIDIFGPKTGDDFEQVEAAAKKAGVALQFCGGCDHSDKAVHSYRVFVNPSQTEVLSTTTAEALAMGKFVLIRRHVSNDFFTQFENTLLFETPDEFLSQLQFALSATPAPLTEEERHTLSWAGATDRFRQSIALCAQLAKPPSLTDRLVAAAFGFAENGGYSGNVMRYLSGAGPVTKQRWLHQQQHFRSSKDVVEVVEKSVEVAPPPTISQQQSIAERTVRTRS